MYRTTIPLTTETRDRLKALGRKGETYENIVNRLVDHFLGIEAPVKGPTTKGPEERETRKGGKSVDFERIK